MQLAWIFQGGVGFVFFIVVNQTKRVVEMGNLAYVQFINIAAGTGSDVAAAVKVADGHQRVSGNNARAEQG